ncbi:MAG: alpha/beta fold hydrolase [Betaproteobacteria bacterium]|nr:alpha/beta fold hydrolase [Betaproteobacteria bacterium]
MVNFVMDNSRKVVVDDIAIEYELDDYTEPWREDLPETVLLHHGYCRNMHFWRPWVPLLADEFRVLRLSGRGCGGTTVPPQQTPYTLERLVSDAIGLLDALSIRRVVWVGESSGGILGLATALAHPDRISALVLCDTPFKIDDRVADAYNVGEADYASAIAKHGFKAWCLQTLGYRIDLSRASSSLQHWYVEQMGAAPEHIAVSHHLMAVDVDIWPRVGEIAAPTLIMVGANSKLATAERMLAMRRTLPAAKLVTFAGFGHGINLIEPRRCVAEVRNFLTEERARTSGGDTWRATPIADSRE